MMGSCGVSTPSILLRTKQNGYSGPSQEQTFFEHKHISKLKYPIYGKYGLKLPRCPCVSKRTLLVAASTDGMHDEKAAGRCRQASSSGRFARTKNKTKTKTDTNTRFKTRRCCSSCHGLKTLWPPCFRYLGSPRRINPQPKQKPTWFYIAPIFIQSSKHSRRVNCKSKERKTSILQERVTAHEKVAKNKQTKTIPFSRGTAQSGNLFREYFEVHSGVRPYFSRNARGAPDTISWNLTRS